MFNTRRIVAAALGAAILIVTSSAGAEGPPVFDDCKFEEAEETAAADGKLLVVDATAVWCKPCKMMDRTTWVDARVVEWLAEHAIAIQFDVDKDRDLSRRFKISAMPTVIAIKDGEEFDRIVGFRDADGLIAWLDGVLTGRRAIDDLRDRAEKADGDGEKVDVDARYDLARALASRREYAAAAEEYLWLWDNMLDHEPSMYGVRLSFMVGAMERVAKSSEPARAAFRARRDEYTPAVDAMTADLDATVDWLHLNKVLNDGKATLAWFDRVKSKPGSARVIDRLSRDLFELLVEHDRWKDVRFVFPDPLAQARREVQQHERMLEQIKRMEQQQPQDMEADFRRILVDKLARLYAAAVVAEKDEAATKISKLAIEADDGKAKVGLVRMAIRAGRPRPEHRKWLREAKESGAEIGDLDDRLESALAAVGGS